MRRLVHGLWSMFWLVGLMVGLPAVLVHYVGWPLPEHWPARQDWQRWVAQPLTRSALVGTAAVIGWLLWALLVYAVVVEVLTRARRAVGRLGRLRLPALPTPMQATASGMLGAAVFSMPTGTAHPPADAVATQPTAAPALPAAADGASVGVPNQAPRAVPSPAGGHASPDRTDSRAGQRAGVALPDGGWVTEDTATATVSAAALVWRRRRRRYLPRPPAGAARDDADLAPLPATVAAIQDELRRRHTGDDHDADDGQEWTDAATAEIDRAAETIATIGQRAGEPLRPHQLPAGGVGLTGDGAAAAARGLLTAVLLSGGGHRDGAVQVVTTATDLDLLLRPTTAAADVDVPGLTVVDSLDDAIGVVERAVLDRARASDTRGVEDAAGIAARPAPPDEFPPLVVLTGSPADPTAARRLAVILTLAAPLRVTGVLLGAWPHGTTWPVDLDGTTHPADTPTDRRPRLSVLTATATTDLLTLLREARPHDRNPADAPTPPLPSDNPGPSQAPAACRQHRRHCPARTPGPAPVDPPARPPLRLRVLGAPAIHHSDDDTAPIPVRRSAAVQVLVFLAVHRDGATSDQLAAALWPGLRPHAAAGRLYTPISSLRTALHDTAGADVIVRDGGHYRLNDQHIDVDLWQLHAAVEDAAAMLDPTDRQRALRAVVDAYTGELAAAQHWPWLAPHREAVRRHVIDAYAALAAAEPDPQAAVAFLQGAIRTDPFNADLHRRMRSYAADGPGTR